MAVKIIVITVFCLSLIGLVFRFVSMFRLGSVFERRRTTLAAQVFQLNYFGSLFNTLFQVRLFRASFLRWVAHGLVFAGFIYLIFVHALDDWTYVFFDDYQPGIDPFRILRNIAGVMVTIGCLAFLWRRTGKSRINRERVRRGLRFRVRGTLSIILILGVIFSGFMAEGLNIMSEPMFDDMVLEYSGLDGEPELIHLKAYWEKYYHVSFEKGVSGVPGVDDVSEEIDLEQGQELNETYCLYCHTLPDTAFISAPLAQLASPIGGWVTQFRLDRVMYWIHFSLVMALILFLPFSRMFHLVSIPAASAGKRMAPEQMGPQMGLLDLASLSACTQCGFCSQVCSVYPDYQISENPQVLPHVKIESLKRLAGKGVWDLTTLTRLRSGNDDCTRCGLCADICPSGIDLVRLWTTAGHLMDRLGCPDNYTAAMETSFTQWADTGRPGEKTTVRAEVTGDKASVKPDFLTGLISDVESFEHCVQCTLCTNTCPVVAYDQVQNDLGPHQVMNLLRLGEAHLASGSKMVWHCLTCYSCQEVCPQSIRVADILLELRCRGQVRAAELTQARLKGNQA